jgi:hypothetical protein
MTAGYNGSGTYVLGYNFVTEAASPPIEISKLKAEFDALAVGLTTVICRDGQSTISANIPFNNKKITGLADATLDTDALNRQTADGRYLLGMTAKTDDYVAVIGDANHGFIQSGASKTFTVPANADVAYAAGTALVFSVSDSGGVTVAIDTDTMYLAGTTTEGPFTLAQYGLATALKLTSTVWIISGSGLSV